MNDLTKRLVALANSLGGTEEADIMEGVAENERLADALKTCRELREYDRVEIDRLRERYSFQVDANRSLVEATAKSEANSERLRAAAKQAETIMMIVEPRSHKAEYLKALSGLRNALEG